MNKNIPIILAHGIAPFDAAWHPLLQFIQRHAPDRLKLDRWLDRFNYFRDIASTLEAEGFTVYSPRVPFAGTLKERSQVLSDNIWKIAHQHVEQVHIIGHSMGGLDARCAVASVANIAECVAMITTISTPHVGTSYADWGTQPGLKVIADDVLPLLHVRGLRDLTTAACREFNRLALQSEVHSEIRYRVYGGSEDRGRVFSLLRNSWDIIQKAEGANDGLVSLKSQLWQSELRDERFPAVKKIEQVTIPFPIDHLNACGWWDKNEPEKRDQYEQRVKNLYLEMANA